MKLVEGLVFFTQTVLAILQFFGAFGSVYFLVYVILLFIEKSRNVGNHYYTDKDLIILLMLFIVSLITHLLGIFGSLRKQIYLLVGFVILIVIETIIFFTTGLLMCGSWNIIALFVALILIALVQHEVVTNSRRKQQPTTITGNTSQNYSYLDNSYSPPDYNSVVFHKPLSPPEYHSVDLIPVYPVTIKNDQVQKY